MTKQVQRTNLEQIQEDTGSSDISVDVTRKRDVDGASELHSTLDEMADSFNVGGFKCVHEECGLVHQHDTTKHRGSDSFDMSEEEAAGDTEFNSVCHCSLNEMAREGIDGAPTPSRANEMAPVPNSVTRKLDSMY